MPAVAASLPVPSEVTYDTSTVFCTGPDSVTTKLDGSPSSTLDLSTLTGGSPSFTVSPVTDTCTVPGSVIVVSAVALFTVAVPSVLALTRRTSSVSPRSSRSSWSVLIAI